jgi:2-oxoglutarate dehydrogenase E1 component
VKRLVLCSGKVAYDLMEARDAAGDKNTAIVRVEQLYPFPSRAAGRSASSACPISKRWSGRRKSRRTTAPGSSSSRDRGVPEGGREEGMRPARYAGPQSGGIARDRPDEAPPAEQAALVADALGHNVREEIRRTEGLNTPVPRKS